MCKILTPIRTLIDFKRVKIKAQEAVTVTFDVCADRLGYYDERSRYCVDSGEMILSVSGNGKDFKQVSFNIV